MDAEHPTDAGTAFQTDDWSEFPAVNVPQRDASQPVLYDGIPAPPGEVFKGWVDNGAGGRAPQFGPPDNASAAPAQIAGSSAAASTPGEQDDWSQFPTAHPAAPEPTVARGAGLGIRSTVEGIDDVLGMPGRIIDSGLSMLGLPGQAATPDEALDLLGAPRPVTDSEKLTSAASRGMAATLPIAALAPETAIPQILSGAGAGTAGEAARQAGYSPGGQLAASLGAGLLTGGAAAGIGAAGQRVFSSTEPSDLLAAFQRQQVTPMPAQVGGYGAKMMTSGAKATLGGIPLASAAERSIATAKAARDRIAASMGQVADDTGAGQAAQRGVNKFIETTQQRAGRFYDAIPIPGDTSAILSNTKTALGELNAGLTSNSELSAMLADGRLKGFEDALAGTSHQVPTGLLDAAGSPITRNVMKGGALSWQDLKSFRSYIGELIGRPTLQDSTSKGALQRLYGALSEDMKATATKQGPNALRSFQRANRFYAARQSRIENTLKLILGNDYQKSAEGAFAQIDRWAREGGDAARLARTIRSLPPDEAATVRATIFSRLGRAAPGQQNAAVDSFSPASFGAQWAKLDHRAKSVLFPTAEYRQSLDDIARIAEAMKASEKFANTSGTALAERIGGNLLGATVLGYIFHPTGAIAGEGVGYSAGLLLGNPRFARWLASAPKKPLGAATLAHINRLSPIAASEPQIANEVLALQERLATAFTASPLPIAAEKPDQRGQVPPQKQGGGARPDNAAYRQWLKTYGIREEPTYDTYAAFKAGLKPSARGHLNDEFKLPNHPTFSNESVHNGEHGHVGGEWVQTGGATKGQPDGIWTFKASPWNLQNMSKPALKRYFDHTEPGMTIIFPDGEHYTGKGAN